MNRIGSKNQLKQFIEQENGKMCQKNTVLFTVSTVSSKIEKTTIEEEVFILAFNLLLWRLE